MKNKFPSSDSLKAKFMKKAKWAGKFVGIPLLGLAALGDGGLFYNYSGPNKITLKTNFGAVAQDHDMKPGFDVHAWPFVYTHDYQNDVQTINFTAGGLYFLPWGESTEDKNHLNAKLKLNYRVVADKEKLGYHRWAMDGFVMQDGFWLLTRMINESANAVMGNMKLGRIVDNSEKFTKLFYEDLTFRLEQNNVPVEIESIELKEFGTFFPTGNVSYQKVENTDAKGFVPVQ